MFRTLAITKFSSLKQMEKTGNAGEVKINYKQIFSCRQRNFRHFAAFFGCPTEISQQFLRDFPFLLNFASSTIFSSGQLFRVTQKHISLIISSFITHKKGAWPWQHLQKLCEKCCPIQKGGKKKCIKAKIPPEVAHFLLSLGTLKLTHKFSSGWPIACGRLSTRYFQSCQFFFFFTKGV